MTAPTTDSPAEVRGEACLSGAPPLIDPRAYLHAMVIPIRDHQGNVVASTIVDPDIYPAIAMRRWSLSEGGYAFRMRKLGGGRQEKLKLHRVVMCCVPGDGLEIDHINRARLDNRRSNLRYVTHAANVQNSDRLPRPVKKGNRWQAEFGYNGARYYVGSFSSFEEADRALTIKRNEVMKP